MFYAEQSMLDPYQDSCRFNHRPRPYEHYSIPSSTSSGGAYASTSTPTTLTPTSLQQAFIELQSVPSSSATDPSHSYAGSHSVDPSFSQYDDSCDEDSSAEPRVNKMGAKIKEEKDDIMQSLMRNRLCPEEEERRRIRRERNKIAAAKCRQRRVDHTNRLIQETEKLEEERVTLQDEIHTLRQQKDQLEFILQAHRPLCKAPAPKNTLHDTASALHDVKVKTERDLVNSCSGNASALPLTAIKQEGNGDGYYGYTADGGSGGGGGVGGGSSPTLISL